MHAVPHTGGSVTKTLVSVMENLKVVQAIPKAI